MKYPFTYLLLFFIFSSYSQISGKIEYKTFLSFDNYIEYDSSLIFNNQNSLFSYKVKEDNAIHENTDSPLEFNSTTIDTTTNIILTDRSKNILLESHDKGKARYFSYEKLPKLEWEFLPQTKTFINIPVSLAKTNFRGRVYYAWYAPTIPISYGPWKLNGLPGLIIEAYDKTKEVVFKFSNIQIPYEYDFDTIKKEINESPQISLIEEISKQKKRNKEQEELLNKIKAKFPRGTNIKIEVKRTAIELNYNDILNEQN
jgi:GLPGLI family protein